MSPFFWRTRRSLCIIALSVMGVQFLNFPQVADSAQKETNSQSALDAALLEQMRLVEGEIKHLRLRVDELIGALQTKQAARPFAPPDDSADGLSAYWDLSLEQAVAIALQNSKSMRAIGATVTSNVKDGVTNWKIELWNKDIDRDEVISKCIGLVTDVQACYWDSWLAQRNLESARSGRDYAQELWKDAHERAQQAKVSTNDEPPFRECYFFFRNSVDVAQKRLFECNSRLQFVLGLAEHDHRLIRPTDQPQEVIAESLSAVNLQADLPEIRKQLREIEQLTAKLPSAVGASRKHLELISARAKAQAEEMRINASHLLSSAIRNRSFFEVVMKTHAVRRDTALQERNTAAALFQEGKVSVDILIDASRRWLQSTVDCDTARADYAKATSDALLRNGTLLEHHRIIVSGPESTLNDR